MVVASLERSYKGYRICGGAESIYGKSRQWHPVVTVTLLTPQHSLLQIYHYEDRDFTGDDEQLAAWFGLAMGEIAVDHLVPPPAYYLTPMNAAWAVDILRRGANDFMSRNIHCPKLYEALDYLELTLDKAWLVKRYRHILRGDCRNWRERSEKQYKLRVAVRGIQLACAAQLIERMNELSLHFRDNKPKIDRLGKVLEIVNKSTSRG